jgi:hypothetical protein
MWKIALGFIVFAGVAVWMLSKGGDIDMGGEKHEISVPQPATPASAPPAVSAPAAVAPALPSASAASAGKL